ncbi:hypothetical protein VT84_36260 [Gemmata sp. SH-PL17]|uniref:hypothetical protein n=1 Tax=Gemmata sp. SH-PL17 TaxID=1630693 RepID=UPI0004B33FF8|nr:hypothetical protein [Gemmata sp. SH-PL17]AMV29905.1 hypothetical protein VT84_36260 [Gemmata sp. SH-PL17]
MVVRRAVAVAGVLALTGLTARAQEPQSAVTSMAGAVVGSAMNSNVVPSPFRAQLVTDNRFPPKVAAPKDGAVKDEERDPRDRTGKMHCLVCEYGLAPVVAIFVRADTSKLKDTDGLSKLFQKLDSASKDPNRSRDGLISKYQSDKLGAFGMFLTLEGGTKAVTVKAPDGSDQKVAVDLEYPHDEKREDKRKEVQRYAGVVKADQVPFGLAADKSAALTAFAVGDAPVTVIIYNRMRIAQRWELKLDDLTDEKVNAIAAAIEEMVRGKQK